MTDAALYAKGTFFAVVFILGIYILYFDEFSIQHLSPTIPKSSVLPLPSNTNGHSTANDAVTTTIPPTILPTTTSPTTKLPTSSLPTTKQPKALPTTALLTTSRTTINDDDPTETSISSNNTTTNSGAAAKKLKLRYDWTSLDRYSVWAQNIASHQSNCTLPISKLQFAQSGLGSNLHVYSRAVCNAMEYGTYRVRTNLPWAWLDTERCGPTVSSALSCYFPETETTCPDDEANSRFRPHLNEEDASGLHCPNILEQVEIPDFRAATIEYLFTRVSQLVQEEGERQLHEIFGGENGRGVPANLITVHIRWGDKGGEMQLLPVESYVNATQQLIDEDPDAFDNNEGVSIFLATEDPAAWNAFQQAAPAHWTIYVDQFLKETLAHRQEGLAGMVYMSEAMKGSPGLITIGSLLVAMEANKFVLTTGSNWSKLINELRRTVVNPRCGNCTRMIDLKAALYEW